MTDISAASDASRVPYRLWAMADRDTSTMGDAALMVAIGRYHHDALAEAYHRHGGAVYGLARRVLRNQALAEEVTQEVFTRLWDRPERFDPERGSLRAFLLADSHGRAVDLIRAESARRAREERDARLLPTQAAADTEHEVWSLVASEQVRAALASLTDDERQAIELAYFDGQSYRQVAVSLAQPEGTIKSRIRTGLRRLQVELAAAGVNGI